MSKISKRVREHKHKTIGDHQKFLSRITKTLYYGKLPTTDSLSLPVTELAAEIFSESHRGRSLDRLHCSDAAVISRNACISPCSLVLALLYLEKLKACNPEYLQRVAPSELFLVTLMVSSKFLYDDGEEDEVFADEWAASGGVTVKELNQLEREFLDAIDWNIYVHEQSFWEKLKAIERAVAKRQGLNRGWFTYTELDNLLHYIDLHSLLQCIATFSLIVLVTYTASVLTILSSMIIVSNLPGTCIENRTNAHTTTGDTQIEAQILDSMETNKTDLCRNGTKLIDAADVLKTGFILASIKIVSDNSTEREEEADVAWEWWENPVMVWLSNSAQVFERVALVFKSNYPENFLETSFANSKVLDLEDQVHKATKIRIQEQMERSWHKEWTDTLRRAIGNINLVSYFSRSVNC